MVNETEYQPADDEATFLVPDHTDVPEDDQAEPDDLDAGHADVEETDDAE